MHSTRLYRLCCQHPTVSLETAFGKISGTARAITVLTGRKSTSTICDKWLDDNYGTGGYDWTDVGGYTAIADTTVILIDGWDFEDDNSGNWTIETEDNFYSFTLLNGARQMIDRNGDTIDTFLRSVR
ncbi:MAG: hypothetical protein ACLTCP_13635 [Ruminococcus bicirculans (ex Wegman et al. 2014)]